MDLGPFLLLELALLVAGLVGVMGAAGVLRLSRLPEGLPLPMRLRLGSIGAFSLLLALVLPFLSPVAVGPLRHHLGLAALAALVLGGVLAWDRAAALPSPGRARLLRAGSPALGSLALSAVIAGILGELGLEIRPLGAAFWGLWVLALALVLVLRRTFPTDR